MTITFRETRAAQSGPRRRRGGWWRVVVLHLQRNQDLQRDQDRPLKLTLGLYTIMTSYQTTPTPPARSGGGGRRQGWLWQMRAFQRNRSRQVCRIQHMDRISTAGKRGDRKVEAKCSEDHQFRAGTAEVIGNQPRPRTSSMVRWYRLAKMLQMNFEWLLSRRPSW